MGPGHGSAPGGIGGFSPEAFKTLAEVEADSFWFRSRNKLILFLIKKYFPFFESFLEVGCGTGFVLHGLESAFPQARFYGSELFIEGLFFARKRLPAVEFYQMDATRMPFCESFDLIGSFDVLEHIENDEAALQSMYEALVPGGGLLVSVPQHAWLWSNTDVQACHVRRYSAAELHAKLTKAGFHIVRSLSFVSILLPLMVASRLFKCNKSKQKEEAELTIPNWLNIIFEKALTFERGLIRAGVNLPCGGSRFVVACKPKR
ncbi:class I SAM-dependent methyltransferase [Desulfovibrio sp. OttesenSCG-928-C14]|nr:class I SAM-dependent methyltransferase [Desulfovibrio sp. OttesenSCG-928-C14]